MTKDEIIKKIFGYLDNTNGVQYFTPVHIPLISDSNFPGYWKIDISDDIESSEKEPYYQDSYELESYEDGVYIFDKIITHKVVRAKSPGHPTPESDKVYHIALYSSHAAF